MLAAVLTPPDVISQMSLAVPLLLLYEGSIWSVRVVEKRAKADEAAKAAAEPAAADGDRRPTATRTTPRPSRRSRVPRVTRAGRGAP